MIGGGCRGLYSRGLCRARSVAVRIGGEEKESVAAVTCFADGTKLPPIIIFRVESNPKHAGMNASKGQNQHLEQAGLPPGVLFSVNEEAYVNEEEMTGVWKLSVIDYKTQHRPTASSKGGHSWPLDSNAHRPALPPRIKSNSLSRQGCPSQATTQMHLNMIFKREI